MTKIKAYTDGACSGNLGPGGWAVYWTKNSEDGGVISEHIYGNDVETTNNKMRMG